MKIGQCLMLAVVFVLAGCIPNKGQLKNLATESGAYSIEACSFDPATQIATLRLRRNNMLTTGEIKPLGKKFKYDGKNWISVE